MTIKRLELQELVRERQLGAVDRREFLLRATAVLGSAAAAVTLLSACAPAADQTPPPVVDSAASAAEPGLSATDGLATGIVRYAGPDDEMLQGYLALPQGEEPRPAVIVIQEWWGLNDHIKEIARRYAAEGYVALAPDLYRGVVTTEPDEARKLAMALGMRDAVGEIRAAMAYVRGLEESNGRIALTGFCMGGGLVLNTAAADDTVGAVAPYYGSPLRETQAATVTAPVISFLGSRDGISAADYEAMHAVLSANGVPNEFHLYQGAQHAFFNDTRASYDRDAAADAWSRTLAWFAEYLT